MLDSIVQFLTDNPLVAIILAVLVIALVAALLKRVFKAAVIIFAILLLSSGTVYHFAERQLEEKGKTLIESGKKVLKKGVKEIERTAGEKLLPVLEDSTKNARDSSPAARPRRVQKKLP
ncbi:MAG: hypothetical protein QHI48_06915 [Bacteroidota bacterium]|nr:hypothetical protein [Bacteroidota bacterium]